jgi:hypothetical protein
VILHIFLYEIEDMQNPVKKSKSKSIKSQDEHVHSNSHVKAKGSQLPNMRNDVVKSQPDVIDVFSTGSRRKNTTVISWAPEDSRMSNELQIQRTIDGVANLDVKKTKNESKLDKQFVLYLDDSRKSVKLCPTQVSLINSDGTLDIEKCINISCFWCRHKCVLETVSQECESSIEASNFESVRIIGCPIRYIPGYVERTLTSSLTKEKYSIKENVSQGLVLHNEKVTSDYYETDGVFCSYQCCLAYIIDNKHNPVYALSRTLLLNIWTSISDNQLFPAPPWKMLKEYGGSLSIEEFRARNLNYSYKEAHSVHRVPLKPVIPIFEEKRYI